MYWVLVDSEGDNIYLLTCVDEVSARREVSRAFEEAPHAPVAGTSTVAKFNEKSQVGRLFLDDIVALRVMDVSPKYSLLTPVRAKNPQEVRGAFCNSRIGVFGPPSCIQMDEGGERRNELWTELRSERRRKLLFQGFGARPWILERRNGLARGVYSRLREDDRCSGAQILFGA